MRKFWLPISAAGFFLLSVAMSFALLPWWALAFRIIGWLILLLWWRSYKKRILYVAREPRPPAKRRVVTSSAPVEDGVIVRRGRISRKRR